MTLYKSIFPAFALLTMLWVSNATAQDAERPTEAWTIDSELSAPESVYFDSRSKFIFISNIAGKPAEKDGSGWISKVDSTGKMVDAQWVHGLNAPKGLRSFKDTLWVSDIDELVGIDIPSGKIKHRFRIEGAAFLNDVAIDSEGDIYVSDMLGNKIFRVTAGKSRAVAEGEQLSFPNGILFHNEKLVMASRGEGLDPKTFVAQGPGNLLALDLKTSHVQPVTRQPLGYLDGLELDGNGGYFVSDLVGGKIYRVSSDGEATVLLEGLAKPADIGIIESQHLLMVPELAANKVTAYKLGD